MIWRIFPICALNFPRYLSCRLWVSSGVSGSVYSRESSNVLSVLKGVGVELNLSVASRNHCARVV